MSILCGSSQGKGGVFAFFFSRPVAAGDAVSLLLFLLLLCVVVCYVGMVWCKSWRVSGCVVVMSLCCFLGNGYGQRFVVYGVCSWEVYRFVSSRPVSRS